MTDQWDLGDLYNIVITWVAERQREGKLSEDWTSVQSFNGDKLLTLRRGAKPTKNGEPYIIIYDDRQPPPRYEAHKYVNYKFGFVEITGKCDAANPKFFEILLNDMIGIQTAHAIETLGDTYEC